MMSLKKPLVQVKSLVILSLLFVSQNTIALGGHRVSLPNVPVPNGSVWQWVGEKMIYNGLPMSIKIFEFQGAESELERYYLNYWKLKGHGLTQKKILGTVTILGHKLRSIYTSIQYKITGNKILGKITVSELPDKYIPRTKTRLPVPPASLIHSRIETVGDNQQSETLNIESQKQPAFNKGFYEYQLENMGWVRIYGADGQNRSVQHYQKKNELLQITIINIGGSSVQSQILLHWTKG